MEHRGVPSARGFSLQKTSVTFPVTETEKSSDFSSDIPSDLFAVTAAGYWESHWEGMAAVTGNVTGKVTGISEMDFGRSNTPGPFPDLFDLFTLVSEAKIRQNLRDSR